MLNNYLLKGKRVLVTGASSGLGKSIAVSLSEREATVFITGRNSERLNETFSLLKGDGHVLFPADLTDEKQIEEIAKNISPLDGVVHCAGITSHIPARLIGSRQISEVFGINFTAPVLLTRHLISKRKISKNASIVFLSSIATKLPYFGGGIYISSKTAIEGYAKTLALELAPDQIRVNVISPAVIHTPMLDKTAETISVEGLEKLRAVHPLGFGSPDDVAGMAAFLLSDDSKWITGENIRMGGM
jgi:NAD(P)-dependent dehydrogenase (short-subunit alcohol dehydrogenase family)